MLFIMVSIYEIFFNQRMVMMLEESQAITDWNINIACWREKKSNFYSLIIISASFFFSNKYFI